MASPSGPKLDWDGDEHLEMPPWEFVLTYLNLKERRFIRKLLESGNHEQALREAKFSCSLQEVLSRPLVRLAIRRCAWLAKDPVAGARMVLPLIMEKQIAIALGDSMSAFPATKAVAEMSGKMPAQKRTLLKYDLSKALDRSDEERPWIDPALPWRQPQKTPSLLPSVAALRERKDVEKAIDEVVASLPGEDDQESR